MVDVVINPKEDTQETTAPIPKKPKSKWRWLKRLLLTILVLLIVLIGFMSWLLGTQSGLHFSVYRIPTWFGVNIKADELNGTVMKGFHAQKLDIKMEGLDIQSSRLDFNWQANELWQGKLHVNRLAIGTTRIQTSPTPPKPKSPPPTLPDSVSLPFQAAIDELSIAELFLEKDQEPVLLGSKIRYQFDKTQHQLVLEQLDTPWNNISGQLSLGTTSPFSIKGELKGSGEVEGTLTKSHVLLSGSMEKPILDAKILGGDVALEALAQVAPFAPLLNEKIINLRITGSNFNPQAFLPQAPKAQMSLALVLQPIQGTDQLQGIITVANIEAGFADESAIPIQTIFGDLAVNEQGILKISNLAVRTLKEGNIEAQGSVDTSKSKMDLALQLNQLTLADIVNNPLKNSLSGKVNVNGTFQSPSVAWNLDAKVLNSQGKLDMVADAKNGQKSIKIQDTFIGTGQTGRINVDGVLNLFQEQKFAFNLNSKNVNPNHIGPDFPVGNINGNIKVNGQLADQLKVEALLDIPNSRLSGVDLRGKGHVVVANEHLEKTDLNLLLGPNKFNTKGSFGLAKDRLNVDINAPQLNYFGFGLSGAILAKGYVAGEPSKLKVDLAGSATNLQFQKVLRLAQLRFNLLASPDMKAPLNIDFKAQNFALLSDTGNTVIDNIDLLAKGSGVNHSLSANANMKLDQKPYRLDLAAKGGLDDKNQWKGMVSTLDIGGAFNIKLRNAMRLEAGAERVSMSQANWNVMGGQLNLQSMLWTAKEGVKTKGNASGLAVQQLSNFVDMTGVNQNIVLAADWDLSYGTAMAGYLKVNRQSGDYIINYRNQPLGLNKLELLTRFQNGRINNQLDFNTTHGSGQVQLAIAQNFGNDIMKAPLTGRILLDVPDLNKVRHFLPVGMEVQGKLNANVSIGGTLGNPQLNGPLNGENLTFREREQGVLLTNGTLKSHLVGQRWVVDSLQFKRNEGTATVAGDVGLDGNQPKVDLTLSLNKFDLFSQPTRRLLLSGQAKLNYVVLQASATDKPKPSLGLDGQLKVDDGLFDFPKSTMPSLDDDVVVLGRQKEDPSQPTLLRMNLTVDLNDKFRFKGQGLDILMGGKLLLTAQPHQDLQANGQIKIVKGSFKAYGQDLVIERGVVSFLGPLDTPALNLRAVRNKSPVGAGVEVRGSLSKPETTLVADEPMSDKDKLAWLVLGRAAGGESDNSALAAAAGAWLAGGINDRIGLFDDLGMSSRQTRNNQTGELNPAEQMITVGKHLTNELYVGYEYGLTSADSAMKVIYQLSKSIQTIVRVGTRSSDGEIRYTIRFD